jgi:hypothetical protein
MTRDRRDTTLAPVERAPSGVTDARAGQEITMAAFTLLLLAFVVAISILAIARSLLGYRGG